MSGSRPGILVADTDGDGVSEVAVADIDNRGPTDPFGIVDAAGEWIWTGTSRGKTIPAVAGDVDGDGAQEVVFRDNGGDNWFRPYGHDGEHLWSNELPDWPDDAAVVDIDGDGRGEVLGVSHRDGHLDVWDDDGTELWSVDDPSLIESIRGWRDVTGDGFPDLLTNTGERSNHSRTAVQLVTRDGDGARRAWTYGPDERARPAFAAPNASEGPAVVVGYPASGAVHGVDESGQQVWEHAAELAECRFRTADVTGDGLPDGIFWTDASVSVVPTATRDERVVSVEGPIRTVEALPPDHLAYLTDEELGVVATDGTVVDATEVDVGRPRDLQVATFGADSTDLVVLGSDAVAAYALDIDRRTVDTATASPPTATAASSYELADAAAETEITLAGTTYSVLAAIPGEDPNRRAVVDESGELVDSTTAKDVLVSTVWTWGNSDVDWESVLEQAISEKQQWEVLEGISRTAAVSSNVAAALALSTLGPTAAMGPALSALDSAIVWAEDEITTPYERQFARMTEMGGTLRWADRETEGATSIADLSRAAIDVVSFAVDAHNALSDVRDVAQIAAATVAVARQTGSVSMGLIAGGTLSQSVAFQMFSGLIVSTTLEETSRLSEHNARTAAAGVAHNTVRIPILRELAALQSRGREDALTPPEVLRYYTYQMVQYQIAAAGTNVMAINQDAVDESLLGSALSAVFNSEELAETARSTAETYANLARHRIAELGAGWQDARELHAESLNVEAFGDGEVDR